MGGVGRGIARVLCRPFRADLMVVGFYPGLRFTSRWAGICRPVGAVGVAGKWRFFGISGCRSGWGVSRGTGRSVRMGVVLAPVGRGGFEIADCRWLAPAGRLKTQV